MQEFYGNMHKEDEKLVTSIRGTQITVRSSMFRWALDILAFIATLDLQFPLDETIVAMTEDYDVQL